MERVSAVLAVLQPNGFKAALGNLDTGRVMLKAIVMDGMRSGYTLIQGERVMTYPFSCIDRVLAGEGKDAFWLLYGYMGSVRDTWNVAKFLRAHGISSQKILNFSVDLFISPTWIGNLRWVERHAVDFFATGISYMEVGIELSRFYGAKGVNLACSNADLRQNLETARRVFHCLPEGSCKFVLIGLAPYSFHYDNRKAFSVMPRDLQFTLALGSDAEGNEQTEFLLSLAGDRIRRYVDSITEEQADLDNERLKKAMNAPLSAEKIGEWEGELKNQDKKLFPEVFHRNVEALEEYIDLCHAHGAVPVLVVLPFAPVLRGRYPMGILAPFRQLLRQMAGGKSCLLADFFDFPLPYDCFYQVAHLNRRGAGFVSSMLHYFLCVHGCIPFESLCSMTYANLSEYAMFLEKEKHSGMVEDILAATEQRVSSKERVSVGFVLYDASMWCGDALYQMFEREERYEPTVYLCLRKDGGKGKLVREDFLHGLQQFRERGIRAVGVEDDGMGIPRQDILVYLTPYDGVLPLRFQCSQVTMESLLVYVPYGFDVSPFSVDYLNQYKIMNFSWRRFYDAKINMEWHQSKNPDRMGKRFLFSGLPKLDFFYQDARHPSFSWKGENKHAIKVVYAPHWSINAGVKYATFQYNYKFMYEYAKKHQEFSWVVKPHPNLMFSAVKSGLFPDEKAFRRYLDDWDSLPNAQVVTGAYYQEIFAGSDGMILDSGSFFPEYQYTHKPLLFLTRDTQKFSPLGEKLMEVLYRVDGQDFEGIESFAQKVLVEGDDFLYERRMKFFREYLDYEGTNHKSASEYIFRAIDDGIKMGDSHNDKVSV